MTAPLITPPMWFDKQAAEAARFYAAAFPNSSVEDVVTIRDTPSGDCDVVYFCVNGQPFMAMSGARTLPVWSRTAKAR